MPPRGHTKRTQDSGSPVHKGNYWYATVRINGKLIYGPPRDAKSEAESDLSRARENDTQELMRDFLWSLWVEVNAEGAPSQDGAQSSTGPDHIRAATASNRSQGGAAEREGASSMHASLLVQSDAQSLTGFGCAVQEGLLVPRKAEAQTLLGSDFMAQSSEAVKYDLPQDELRNLARKMGLVPACKRKWKANAKIKAELHKQDEDGNLPQPNARGRFAAAKQAAKRSRQTSTSYRAAKRKREITPKYKFTKRFREALPRYRAKRQERENAPKGRLARKQRKWAHFWLPCLFNFNVMRGSQEHKEANNVAPYAPRFHADGRISIMQHGVIRYLPCPDEPSSPTSCDETELSEIKDITLSPNRKDGKCDVAPIGSNEYQYVDRLMWRAEGPDFQVHFTDATGGLSGSCQVISSIRKMVPDAVYFEQVKRYVRERAPTAAAAESTISTAEDTMCEDADECFSGSSRASRSEAAAALEGLVATALGRATGQDSEEEEQDIGKDPAEQPVDVSTQRNREFGLALALRCHIGSFNCARELGFGFDRGHGCCTKWRRDAVCTWRQNQKLSARSWRASQVRGLDSTHAKTRQELESSSLPLDKKRLRLGLYTDLDAEWFWIPWREPTPPLTGCVHARRLKRHSWRCPMAEYTRVEILEASGQFKAGAANAARVYEIRRQFLNPPENVRELLCCDSCPRACCTLKCPWNPNALAESGEPLALYDCSCGSVACGKCSREAYLREVLSDVCVEDPPLPGRLLFAGAIEPILDCSVQAREQTVYMLTCRFWKVRAFRLGNSMPPFAVLRNGHWKDTVRRRGARPAEYEVSSAAWCKDYSLPARKWTSSEGRSWNLSALSEQDYSRSCGYEWRWEKVSSHQYPELMSYPHLEVAAVDESKEYVVKLERQNKPDVELLEQFSLRCTFCVLLHGETGSTVPHCGRSEKQSPWPHLCPQKGSRPPEDIAIRIAQAVACLYSQWYGKAPCVFPGAVVKYAQDWESIAPLLACHEQENVLDGDLERLYMLLWDLDLQLPCSFVRDECVLPWRAQRAAEAAFIKQLVNLKHELEERMLQAWEPEGMQLEKEKDMNIVRVSSSSHLTHDFTQQLLERHGFASPFFSMVPSGKLPRLTIGATEDCKCQVPWNKRSRWERFPHVEYELPAGTSPWQSLGQGSESHWLAKGLEGDCALQDELVALEPCISDDDLFSYCMALQTVLSGSREQFALTGSLAAAIVREQSQANLDPLPVLPDAFVDLAKERPNYVDKASSFEASRAEQLCAAESYSAEVDARAQSPELLRWS